MSIRWITGDVFDGLAQLEDGSVDLVVTSPPFLALRSYLPADHPDKEKEIGSEATPAEYLDTLLAVTAELRRVLAPHGSIAIELGDTYAGSGGAGGDYAEDGLRDGQPKYRQIPKRRTHDKRGDFYEPDLKDYATPLNGGPGWPLAKSKTLIPQLYEIALAYGINPLTGTESPAGQWRIRNVVTWARPNPPVGALGDKWRPATSDVVVACVSSKRYWDDLATRKGIENERPHGGHPNSVKRAPVGLDSNNWKTRIHSAGAPLLDYWEIPPGGYKGAHYAVFPPALVEPLVKAMCPEKVCRTCGEPSRRIIESDRIRQDGTVNPPRVPPSRYDGGGTTAIGVSNHFDSEYRTVGWTDCGHGTWRPGHVLDCFAGSGTTGVVATGHGHDVTLIDLDERNCDLARERIGPLLFEVFS